MKPLWASRTVRDTLLVFGIALLPHLETYARTGTLTSLEAVAIVGTLLFTCDGIAGRHDAKDIIYTPRGWPGRNPEEARRIEQHRQGE